MINKAFVVLLALGSLAGHLTAQTAFDYPKPRKADQTDEYHGVKVADPYRWLEDADSPETRQWIDAENKITSAYLSSIPQREAIKGRLTELWNYEKFGMPFKVGKHYIYTRNDGLQNQSVWYFTDSLTEPGKVFFDPNKLAADGTADGARDTQRNGAHDEPEGANENN